MNESLRQIIEQHGKENTLLKAFAAENLVDIDAQNTFECRGCGIYCCVDKVVVLRPSEYYRIHWFLVRHPKISKLVSHYGSWVSFSPGSTSGVPIAVIEFAPIDFEKSTICPFLLPRSTTNGKFDYPHAVCGIYPVRPVPCRGYPYGRAETVDKEKKAVPIITVVDRCPGFDHPEELSTQETIGEFLDRSRPEEWNEEIECCNQLISDYATSGLHAPTKENPDAMLNYSLAVALLTPMLYAAPPCPIKPEEDHSVIMDHLKELNAKRSRLADIFTRVEKKEISHERGISQIMALI